MRRILVIVIVAALSLMLCEIPLWAKSRDRVAESFDVLWSAAVRLIRVDKNWKIVDKDKETGFIIFEYQSKESSSQASVEILKDAAPEEKNVSRFVVQVSIPSASSIEERLLIDELKRKIQEER
ncbi:MAG: hypothetical protein C4523_12390 [Myxococcales bacterium]|nr:MAG: hypothetical protein C4523_12390 [Myxococcales bacterium]